MGPPGYGGLSSLIPISSPHHLLLCSLSSRTRSQKLGGPIRWHLCLHPLTTHHSIKTKFLPRAQRSDSDSQHAAPASSPSEVNLDEDEASKLQCFGIGSDVECVAIRSNRDAFIDGDDDDVDVDARNVGRMSMGMKGLSPASGEMLPLVSDQKSIECVGMGTDVECVIVERTDNNVVDANTVSKSVLVAISEISTESESESESVSLLNGLGKGITSSSSPSVLFIWLNKAWENMVLISPFFFWGTAMVAMKGVLPKAGPLFVASTRLIPSGFLLIAFAKFQNRKQPSGLNAWFAITLFALVDATCFQGFLAEGLKRTSAGLGSVIIDSQPLTVAIIASIFFGETIGVFGVLGLATGVIGLLLLEVQPQVLGEFFKGHFEELSAVAASKNGWSIWDSGEWWMLLAAQSMAVGTVMVRWLCQFADPVMATGWHMVIGGIPLLALAIIQHDPALSGHIQDLEPSDWLSLVYVSVFGSAISYGVFFYNASRGSLTKLSSLTFLTPMFAALFGYLLLDETLSPMQIVGAFVTLASIYLINKRTVSNNEEDAKT